ALAATLNCVARASRAEPIVWTGPDVSFTKMNNSDFLLPENQDFLTDNVRLTRGALQGMINAVYECDEFACTYTRNLSPQDTEWATGLMQQNSGLTISAENWESLTFTDWEAAYLNQVGNTIVNEDAVVHLISDDIYL